jgi:medium-chain acyl-[acyl-carrier-protein] hydrolase
MTSERTVDAPAAWFAGRRPVPSARLRLFCFPYAGLGASVYRSWVGRLGVDVDVCPVQLPGRETRMHERPFTRMRPLVDALAAALQPALDVPFAIFGHSLGAVVGFELARALRDAGGRSPAHLFVSARRAPHFPERLPKLHVMSDEALLAEVQRRYQGIPAALLDCPDLVQMLLPRLRADLELLETWSPDAGAPLDVPISTFAGLGDALTSIEEVEGWRKHTTAAFRLRRLAGGHLFLQQARDVILAALREDLELAARPVAAC